MVDYWNEASELETGAAMPHFAPHTPGEMVMMDESGMTFDTSTITDMMPLITMLAVVSMAIGLLQRAHCGGARP